MSPPRADGDSGGGHVFACPHCHQRTVTLREKLFLGPKWSVRCDACHRHWRVSNVALFAPAAVIGLTLLLMVVARPTPKMALFELGAAVVLIVLIQLFGVPLVRR
jgi:hypothetical protein